MSKDKRGGGEEGYIPSAPPHVTRPDKRGYQPSSPPPKPVTPPPPPPPSKKDN
jgi:hypothetical protein